MFFPFLQSFSEYTNPIRSFRNDLWPGYKTDEGVPAELHAQFDVAEEAVRALGATVWSMREFEADDALATGALRFRDEVEQVRILTPDKDLGQCLCGRREGGSHRGANGGRSGGPRCPRRRARRTREGCELRYQR